MRDDHLVGEGRLFQPDIMLPAQYFTLLRKQAPQGPEYGLVIAMLQDAIECVQKYRFATDENGRALFEDARDWVASDDRKWPFSFENVCGILNLNADYLRRGLSRVGRGAGRRGAQRQGGADQAPPPARYVDAPTLRTVRDRPRQLSSPRRVRRANRRARAGDPPSRRRVCAWRTLLPPSPTCVAPRRQRSVSCPRVAHHPTLRRARYLRGSEWILARLGRRRAVRHPHPRAERRAGRGRRVSNASSACCAGRRPTTSSVVTLLRWARDDARLAGRPDPLRRPRRQLGAPAGTAPLARAPARRGQDGLGTSRARRRARILPRLRGRAGLAHAGRHARRHRALLRGGLPARRAGEARHPRRRGADGALQVGRRDVHPARHVGAGAARCWNRWSTISTGSSPTPSPAAARLEPAAMRDLLGRGPFVPAEARDAGLVDVVAHADEIEQRLVEACGGAATIDRAAYAARRGREMRIEALRRSRATVALLHIGGTIKPGDSIPGPGGAQRHRLRHRRRGARADPQARRHRRADRARRQPGRLGAGLRPDLARGDAHPRDQAGGGLVRRRRRFGRLLRRARRYRRCWPRPAPSPARSASSPAAPACAASTTASA